MLNALTNARFWGKADMHQPLLTNLDMSTRPNPPRRLAAPFSSLNRNSTNEEEVPFVRSLVHAERVRQTPKILPKVLKTGGSAPSAGLPASKPLKTLVANDGHIDILGGSGKGRGRIPRNLRQAILDAELTRPPKGFRVGLYFQDEAPAIGAGQRSVLVQFRGKKVILHGGGYTATMRRDAFKDLVASNRRYRRRNKPKRPQLKLVVNNPPRRQSIKEEAA